MNLLWRCAACALTLIALRAQAALPTLSLDDAIELALDDALQTTASTASVEAAEALAPSAGRLPDPELIAGVENLPIETADRFSVTRDFMTMRKIGVMQSFPSATKRRLQSERATREVAVAQGELRKSRFETARAVAEAWITVAAAEASLARLRTLQPDVKLQTAAARAALSAGRASSADALGAESFVAAFDQRLLLLEQETQMKRAELARWIGEAADRPLASIPTDRELTHSAKTLVAAVPTYAPLAPLAAQVAEGRIDVELARAARRPDWSAELAYAQRGPGFSNMVSLEFRVGLPLFPKYRQNPMVARKLATVRALQAEQTAEVRMQTAEVRMALVEWQLGRKRLKHYQTDLLPLARDRSMAALASYRAGGATLASAVEALQRDIDTQLAEIELESTVARAWAFLHLLHDSGDTP